MVLLAVVCTINVLLVESGRDESLEQILTVVAWIGIAAWATEATKEILQAIGYCAVGLARSYLRDFDNLIDFCVISLAGFVYINVLIWGNESKDNIVFVAALCIVVYLRWLKFLFAFKGI